jgi:oligogalacturonide lyase
VAQVDRIVDDSIRWHGPTQIHRHTEHGNEGHECFGGDAATSGDLQTPRSGRSGSLDEPATGPDWYTLEAPVVRPFNVSPDGTFRGRRWGPSSVAAPGNGQWIYLFRPQLVRDRTDNALPNSNDLIQPGVLRAEKLVNLARHDYSLEPNVTFTPDMRWIVFRSNMFGPTHVFAVEVNKQ